MFALHYVVTQCFVNMNIICYNMLVFFYCFLRGSFSKCVHIGMLKKQSWTNWECMPIHFYNFVLFSKGSTPWTLPFKRHLSWLHLDILKHIMTHHDTLCSRKSFFQVDPQWGLLSANHFSRTKCKFLNKLFSYQKNCNMQYWLCTLTIDCALSLWWYNGTTLSKSIILTNNLLVHNTDKGSITFP